MMTNKQWKISFDKPVIPETLIAGGYSPLLSAVLHLRGIDDLENVELEYGNSKCIFDAFQIKDMDLAVNRLKEAFSKKEKIIVYGDYDVDGITASCLLCDYIRSKGNDCDYYIPDRTNDGYGLNTAALDKFKSSGVDLVITVDCGITAFNEAEYSKQLGIDLVITDHHECSPGGIPNAYAVVDIKRKDDSYPNKSLAGVGVAFKLVCACEENVDSVLNRYADLFAIGTVADVMSLRNENRFIVTYGLNLINSNPRPGIYAMLQEAFGNENRSVTATAIGFSLAPRLNAAGRLGSASLAADLIMAEDPSVAFSLAAQLNELNRERQRIENTIWHEAVTSLGSVIPTGPLVLANENWHQGVIGIAASRLAEQYCLPSVMIYLNGEVGKGSCRSYGNFNLYEALAACSEHLIAYGGHALAAGISISKDKISDFRAALNEYYNEHKPDSVPATCCELTISDPALLSVENVRALDFLEPYGNDNPKPIMCMYGVKASGVSLIGNGKHMKMRVTLNNTEFDCIFFSHTPDNLMIKSGDLVDIAFTPQINVYKGRTSVQLALCDARPHSSYEFFTQLLGKYPQNVYYTASRFVPYFVKEMRNVFKTVWYHINQDNFVLGRSAEDILLQSPEGLPPELFLICLLAFKESGLLQLCSEASIYGASVRNSSEKVNLEETHIMQSLRSI